jgi:hypothetical protein
MMMALPGGSLNLSALQKNTQNEHKIQKNAVLEAVAEITHHLFADLDSAAAERLDVEPLGRKEFRRVLPLSILKDSDAFVANVGFGVVLHRGPGGIALLLLPVLLGRHPVGDVAAAHVDLSSAGENFPDQFRKRGVELPASKLLSMLFVVQASQTG